MVWLRLVLTSFHKSLNIWGEQRNFASPAFFLFLFYIESVFVTFLCDLFQTCETRCLLAEKIVILAKNNKIHYFFPVKKGKQQNMQQNYVEFVVCVRKISSFLLLWVEKWTFWPVSSFFMLRWKSKTWTQFNKTYTT